MTTIRSTASDAIRKSGQFESTINQLMDLERSRLRSFERERTTTQGKTKLVNEISSELVALRNMVKRFKISPSDTLSIARIDSSNPTSFSARAIAGSLSSEDRAFEVEILQLARADRMTSSVISDSGTRLAQSGSGHFEFMASPTADPITVSIETSGKTDRQILTEVAAQLNQKAGASIRAELLQVSPGNSILSVQQRSTGAAHTMTVNATAGDFATLEFEKPLLPSELDARLRVNGILFERPTNSIDDLIPGVQLDLSSPTSKTEQVTLKRDVEATATELQKLVEAFNKLTVRIRTETRVDTKAAFNGPLSTERQVRALSQQLGQIVASALPSLNGEPIRSLLDLGISSETNGGLKLTDRNLLLTRLSESPELVSQLFNSEDGLVARLDEITELYTKSQTGFLNSISQGFDERIKRINSRISRENVFMERRENQLRAEFAQLEQLISMGQSQMNQVIGFGNRLSAMMR